MLNDTLQRQLAIDPRQSFIVQAPAGSGKTELLTQRYLRLLGQVSTPEQIVALTFTRKAASEMRARILLALKQVASGIPANSAHQQQTFAYAEQALAQSAKHQWHILEQPTRLHITTIDSFCQILSHAIPLQEKQIPYAQINDKPRILYQAAAMACFSHCLQEEKLHADLSCLLHHLDNRQDQLVNLFSDLLARREQWLTIIYSARPQKKADYEKMLLFVERHELSRLQECIPREYWDELCLLAQEIASIEADANSPRFNLRNWQDASQVDSAVIKSLASLLLTSQNGLRKSFDHHVGLKRGACSDELYNILKSRSKELLGALTRFPDFLDSLICTKSLPPPHYAEEQWRVLQALFTLLPLLVAHLQLVFREQDQVDFTAISQEAVLALGEDEQPTDLALYLDNAISHFLIDEFQDTSIQQFQLISKLVRGWQPNDNRTLFVVGDPMQSIYRFRQAEVGLFLKAQQEGIGSVQLTPLELSCNFRSTPALINWVNSQFKLIFPQSEDIELGAVSFHPAIASEEPPLPLALKKNNVCVPLENKTNPPLPSCLERGIHTSFSLPPEEMAGNEEKILESTSIIAWQFLDRVQQAEAIVNIVKQQLSDHPQDTVAILVRSRNQLGEIITQLRKQQLPFQGVEIELLAQLSHLRDLWSLTQALLLPANRLAWLAVLRSPWCGLSLADLHTIANFDKKKSIYLALSQLDKLPTLSTQGRKRAQFIFTALREALACRHQYSLVDWLMKTSENLHSDKIYNAEQQADVEQFWCLLERFTGKGQPLDFSHFQNEFKQLYSQNNCTARLQIMTVHKSKGLEFDCVILPSLSAKSANPDNPLFRWLKLPKRHGEELMLISPIKAAGEEHCLLYDYLKKLDAEKDKYELQRLLYVATTRAKKRLYLVDCSEKEIKGSFRQLLAKQPFSTMEQATATKNTDTSLAFLYRLPIAFYETQAREINSQVSFSQQLAPESSRLAAQTTARQTGIVAHELLKWICDNHPASTAELPWKWIATRFKSLGFNDLEQQEVLQNLQKQVAQLFANPIGRWLIKPHMDERNEYELLIDYQGLASTRIIDRTFCEEGIRWIIDFKTGDEGEQTQSQHREQVNAYAQLLTSITAEPLRCGLYYLASGNWLQWDYSVSSKAPSF